MKREGQNERIVNHFEAGANCQVFNGDIRGCVFAMPGANVRQQAVQPQESGAEGEQGIVDELKPMFFGIEENARRFIESVQGAKPTQITDLVNQWVRERKISDLSRKSDLWRVLHDCGIYTKSKSNWNMQVK